MSTAESVPLRFVFEQQDPGSPDLTFVEVETLDGKSVSVGGEWEEHKHAGNGARYLAFTVRVLAEEVHAVNQ